MNNDDPQPSKPEEPSAEEPMIVIERDSDDAVSSLEGASAASDASGLSEPSAREERVRDEEPPARRRDVPLELMMLFIPTLVFFCYLLVPVYLRIDAAAKYPFELDGEEGFVFYDAVQLRLGRPIYQSIEEEPFVVGNYPPLYAWAVSRILDPNNMGLNAGRLVTALSAIIITQLIIMIVFYRTRRIVPTFLAPLMFLVTYEFYQWSAYTRVDLPALMLSLLGLYIFMVGRSRWMTALAAIVFVLAAFTRVTSILAPAACCLSMLVWDRRRLIWFLVPYLGLGFGALAVINAATGGEFFTHIVRYNNNEMNWAIVPAILKNEIWFFYRWWIVAIAAGAVFGLVVYAMRNKAETPGENERYRSHLHARGVLGIYFLLGALSLASFAKAGSAANYALEPLAAAGLFGMTLLGRLCDAAGGEKRARRLVARWGVAAMGLAMLGHTWHVRQDAVASAMFSSPTPDNDDFNKGRAILEAVRSAPGDVLSELPVFSILAGKPVTYEPYIMSLLAAEGKWDERKIIDQISLQRFGLLVTAENLEEVKNGAHFRRYSQPMARAVTQNYKVEYVIRSRTFPAGVYLWLPRPKPKSEGEAEFIAFGAMRQHSRFFRSEI